MLDTPHDPAADGYRIGAGSTHKLAAESVKFLHVGAIVASTLYLGACLMLGYLTHNGFAWKLALLATAATYLSHIGQAAYACLASAVDAIGYRKLVLLWRANWIVVGCSIVWGALAGIALLVAS